MTEANTAAAAAAALAETLDPKPEASIRRRSTKGGRPNRRKDILLTLAALLEDPACDRITTALIAQKLNLSEGALYRSYPSKYRMFDGLLDYIEGTVMEYLKGAAADSKLDVMQKVALSVNILLDFSNANPGLTRILTCQVLLREDPRLMERMMLLVDKFEAHLRSLLREAVREGRLPADYNASARANLLVNWVTGRWARFANTNFRVRPNGITMLTIEPMLRP